MAAADSRAAEPAEHPIVISEESSEDESDLDLDLDLDVTRSTTAFCVRCQASLGNFYNAWFKITNSYYLPALRGSYDCAGLRPAGKERAASVGTTLDGCLIRPLACNSCSEILAIVCTNAPEDKSSYTRREFFKLPRMELRCDTTHKIVKPVVELAPPDLRPLPAESRSSVMSEMDHGVPAQARGGSTDLQHRPSPALAPAPAPAPAAPVPEPTQHHHHHHHQQQQQHQHLHQKHLHHHHRQPTPSASPASRPRDILPANGSPQINGLNGLNGPNGIHHAAPPHDSVTDAIARLQTQVSFNTAGLVSQRRDFEKLAEQVVRLETVFVTLRHDVRALASVQPPVPAQANALDDATLESFARNLSSVANKANEVDSLGMQLEIVKRRINIMESRSARGPMNAAPANAAPANAPPANAPPANAPPANAPPANVPPANVPPANTHGVVPFASPHETPHQSHAPPPHAQQAVAPQPSLPSHPAPNYRHTPPMPRLGTPARTETLQEIRSAPQPQTVPYHPGPTREAAAPQYHNHSVPTQQQEPPRPLESQPQPVQQTAGWVSVNPGVKRAATNGVESPSDGKPDESKRPKLAPLEPRVSQGSGTPFRYERMDTAETDYQSQHSHESQYDSSTNPTNFVPFNSTTQHGYAQDHEDKWRVMSSTAPGSVGRDGISPKRGRGGRPRGRGRKTLPLETHNLTPEWEKPDWSSTPNGQDSYYHTASTPIGGRGRGNVVRRGSGGGPMPMRPIEVTSPSDPYGNKKTRTRPFRNADGVLIRKDGRPDMRSQSSAANLRKVHARKEQERIMEQRANTPSSALATAPVVSLDSESPDPDAPPMSTEDKHRAIMRKMFPHGVDDQATKRNFHEQYFPAGSSPVSAPVYPRVKPEVNTPSERYMDDASELSDEQRDETEEPKTNGHSPAEPENEAGDGDGMEVETQNGHGMEVKAQNGDRMEVEQASASASASATPA
ncbi:hypothetical protein K490DRAFT_64790 [Saccharata proteae CBS 121410]|uniref:Uncharacterized protein n=1 Tax=Saccharata proteae CBS 121410 TaxID=1314787 RepID=A0A9P4HYX6_9PEZI|nr:hypothetical protein K490DRAFT_64790 [Saccharata proteae CBS 121410]